MRFTIGQGLETWVAEEPTPDPEPVAPIVEPISPAAAEQLLNNRYSPPAFPGWVLIGVGQPVGQREA